MVRSRFGTCACGEITRLPCGLTCPRQRRRCRERGTCTSGVDRASAFTFSPLHVLATRIWFPELKKAARVVELRLALPQTSICLLLVNYPLYIPLLFKKDGWCSTDGFAFLRRQIWRMTVYLCEQSTNDLAGATEDAQSETRRRESKRPHGGSVPSLPSSRPPTPPPSSLSSTLSPSDNVRSWVSVEHLLGGGNPYPAHETRYGGVDVTGDS